MTRTDCIKEILENIQETDILISSTGYISREVFKQKDRPLNFYMMGSMGNALAIGLGIALNVKERVIVINGDGSVLMSLGTMVLIKKYKPHNLHHYIIDNNCHESTGCQPTVSNYVSFVALSNNVTIYKSIPDDTVPPRITLSPKQIKERFKSAIENIGYKQVQP